MKLSGREKMRLSDLHTIHNPALGSTVLWRKPWFQFTILLLLALIWGSSFILMKIGLKSFNSYQAAALRIFFASSAILPLAIKNIRQLKRSDLVSLLVVGFIGSFFPAFLFTKAQTQIDSALAGMLNSLTPVFTLIIGILFLKNKTGWIQLTGLCLGLLGAMGLISNGADISLGEMNSYALLIVLATVFYGTNVNVIKSKLTHLSGAQITSFSFMFLWPVSFVYLITSDFHPALSTPDWQWHLVALAVLGIIGTATAMLLMNSLIRYTTPIHAASVTYIIPIFAIFWGLLDGEKVTGINIIFMAVILLGVYLINKNPLRLKPKTKPSANKS